MKVIIITGLNLLNLEDHKPQLVVPNVLFYRGLTDGFLQKINEVKDQLGLVIVCCVNRRSSN